MFYITGDTHGDFTRIEDFCDEYGTTKADTIIILGDAGINYHLNERDNQLKEKLAKLPITLFCIHGNHEERPYLIDSYDEKMWNEGLVYYEKQYPNILFASDGEIYNFEGNKVIAIGGAYSVDKNYRIRGNMPWFESEQPDERTKEFIEHKLEQANWKVDFVLSHTGPLKYVPEDEFLPMIDQSGVDQSTEEWLDFIEDKLDYELWYFGHFHCDRMADQTIILFEDIIDLVDASF
ncbi:metallophosphoesterase [Proteinivorax tanatarense]|uniref:Metallophosphoesterase n=1 Tax=Proteinivorax tanatarense TaxID=1260629 RepID=A0AAU7VHR9_9FIRM